jgi:hypothetical protein
VDTLHVTEFFFLSMFPYQFLSTGCSAPKLIGYKVDNLSASLDDSLHDYYVYRITKTSLLPVILATG